MFTPEMFESIKKVEATRAERMATEPRRMTAEEKDELLKKEEQVSVKAGELVGILYDALLKQYEKKR